jgi:uncharacterized protein
LYYTATQSQQRLHVPLDPLKHLIPAISWGTVAFCSLIFRLRFGFDVVARPDLHLKRWYLARKAKKKQATPLPPTPILLIHSAGDRLIPIEHSHHIADYAQAYNIPLVTFFSEAPGHCGAYAHNAHQYLRVVHDFLVQHLGDDFPLQHHQIDKIDD